MALVVGRYNRLDDDGGDRAAGPRCENSHLGQHPVVAPSSRSGEADPHGDRFTPLPPAPGDVTKGTAPVGWPPRRIALTPPPACRVMPGAPQVEHRTTG